MQCDECFISVGSNVQFSWQQIAEGAIIISLRSNTPKRGSTQVFHDRTSARTLRIRLAAQDEQHGDQSDTATTNSGNDGLEHIYASQHQIYQSDSSSFQVCELRQVHNPPAVPMICHVCEGIRAKIDEGFGKWHVTLKRYHESWRADPTLFFGTESSSSSEQWSFRTLVDMEDKVGNVRAVFHKLNLAYCLHMRIRQSGYPETTCRQSMLQEIYPGYRQSRRRATLRRRLNRYVAEGRAIILIAGRNAGLLFTALASTSGADLRHLSDNWLNCGSNLNWLSATVLTESTTYAAVALAILPVMQVDQKYILPPDQSIVGSVSMSPEMRLLPSLSAPRILLIPHTMMRFIKVYYQSYCRNMTFDTYGTLTNSSGEEYCNNFDSYCYTATMLVQKKRGFVRVLDKALALVHQILLAEHPRTLVCFLEVLIHLSQSGLPEVAAELRSYIAQMASNVIKEGTSWRQICQFLGQLDQEFIVEALGRIWECIIDTFSDELGSLHRFAVSTRVDFIKRVYGGADCSMEGQLLQNLSDSLGERPTPAMPRVLLNQAHNLGRQNRQRDAENKAITVFALLETHEMYATRIVERIECKKIQAHSLHIQGMMTAAEQTMQEAIQLIRTLLGTRHSWVFEFLNVLEVWQRDWGREDAANETRVELEAWQRDWGREDAANETREELVPLMYDNIH